METSDRRAKLSETCDSLSVVEPIWGTFDLAAFIVIWRSLGTLAIFFRKYAIQNASSTNCSLSLSDFSMNYLLNGAHKTAFGIFEISKLKF